MGLALAAHQEVRLVDELLANANVALEDKGACMVNRLGVVHLVHTGLETALQELLGGQTEDVIETLLVSGQDSVTHQAAEHGITLEEALGVLLVERQQLTRGGAHLGQGQLCAPDLALATQAVLAQQLHLLIETLLLVWAARRLGRLAVVPVETDLWPAA